MDVARLNFSHGTVEEHAETSRMVRDAASAAGRPVAVLQDLPGPKMRIGQLARRPRELETGSTVTFVCREDGPATHGRSPSRSPSSPMRSIPARSSTSPTARSGCASPPSAPGAASSTARSSSAGASPLARG